MIDERKIKSLEEAARQAREFAKRADAAVKHLKSDDYAWFRSPPFAAAKRASMDLHYALVNVRKGGK